MREWIASGDQVDVLCSLDCIMVDDILMSMFTSWSLFGTEVRTNELRGAPFSVLLNSSSIVRAHGFTSTFCMFKFKHTTDHQGVMNLLCPMLHVQKVNLLGLYPIRYIYFLISLTSPLQSSASEHKLRAFCIQPSSCKATTKIALFKHLLTNMTHLFSL